MAQTFHIPSEAILYMKHYTEMCDALGACTGAKRHNVVLLPMPAGLARPRNTETSGPLAGYKHVPGCRGKKNPVPGDTGCLLGVTPRYLPSKGPVRGGEPKLMPRESSMAVRGNLIPSKTQKQCDFV